MYRIHVNANIQSTAMCVRLTYLRDRHLFNLNSVTFFIYRYKHPILLCIHCYNSHIITIILTFIVTLVNRNHTLDTILGSNKGPLRLYLIYCQRCGRDKTKSSEMICRLVKLSIRPKNARTYD